ncbi:MAG: exosortase/archaeosortase family protein [Nitrososphaerota archaeon]|nr:exosortase/archaeosortase family protein [Nitrososphaerota archaeon]
MSGVRGGETSYRTFVPVAVATAVSLGLYYQQALLLLLKIGEVLNGVFDTSVPSFPLAGMLFVVMFIALRREEFLRYLGQKRWDGYVAASGVAMAVLPLVALALAGGSLSGSYSFAAIALTTCWVGVLVALKPSTFRFLWPYLLAYLLAVGSVGMLTTAFGDPLAIVVASVSRAITTLLHVPVSWTSVYMTFTAAGGGPVSLYISQECSGMASMAIFLLLIAMMHLDVRPSLRTSTLFAIGGSLLFILLNSLRVVILIVAGVYYSEGLLWNLHGWVGYVFYVVGYAGLVAAYVRVKDREVLRGRHGGGEPSGSPPRSTPG